MYTILVFLRLVPLAALRLYSGNKFLFPELVERIHSLWSLHFIIDCPARVRVAAVETNPTDHVIPCPAGKFAVSWLAKRFPHQCIEIRRSTRIGIVTAEIHPADHIAPRPSG